MNNKFFFFGDSIMAGSWDANGGWAFDIARDILSTTLDRYNPAERYFCLPYLLGISGDSAATMLHRLENEVTARCTLSDPQEYKEVVIAIGLNDSNTITNENRREFSLDVFKKNITDLILLAQKLCHRVSFIGLTAVDEKLTAPFIPWPESSYFNRDIEESENIIAQACHDHDVPFLPLFKTWINTPHYKDLLIDGIHPNAKGHAYLKDLIYPFLLGPSFIERHSR